ncbi:MAG: hypothetical protein Q4D16_14020 [Eubacteriales bacterium]|nr:hypothetical protein [Eubacteriales bacterium]
MYNLGIAGFAAAFSFTICWLPFDRYNKLEGFKEYNNTNPLYVRGFLIKKSPKSKLLCKLKGIYYCQIISAILMCCVFIYLGYYYLNGFQRIFHLEIIFTICFTILFIARLFFQSYYLWCYHEAYRYSQNKNGIWTPFSFIFKGNGGDILKSFSCNYHIDFEKIMETVKESCKTNNYTFSESYKIDDKAELSFFTRHFSNKLDVLSLVHVDMLEIEHWDKFNEIFGVYWKCFVKEKYEFEEARFTFLLCIDNQCKQLRRIDIGHSIDQKKGRYRLPAVLSYYDNDTLTINSNCSRRRGQKQYNEMREELLSILKVPET